MNIGRNGKIFSLVAGILFYSFLVVPTLYASEQPAHLSKENAVAIKVGGHFYEHGDDLMDFWDIDESDMRSLAFELAYERKIATNLGIELAFGYFKSDETYHDVLFYDDSSRIEIEDFYFSPTLKYYLPATNSVVFYLGIGPDLYYTEGDYKYKIEGVTYYKTDDDFLSVGAHGLAGIEWYVYKHPASSGYYDAPVSLFLEYKYSWVEVDDADEKVIKDVNYIFDASLSKHDLNVGGHMVFAGLRWHF